MKKIISLVLILTLSLFAFAACGGKDNDDDNTPTEKNYSLAIGVDMTIDEKEVANTVAVIVIDENGKVVSCRLDALALEAAFADGAIDESKTYQSKREKGDKNDDQSLSFVPFSFCFFAMLFYILIYRLGIH